MNCCPITPAKNPTIVFASPPMPSVPLDDELPAVLSIGVPVALCVYLAWVRRDRPADSTWIGLAAAAAGALIGAWLGFHAATDLLALVTAIAGAVAGANLTLILLDMSRGGRGVPRVKPPSELRSVRAEPPVAVR